MKSPYTLNATNTIRTDLSPDRALERVRRHIGDREGWVWWQVSSGAIGDETFTVKYWFMRSRFEVAGRLRGGRSPLLVVLRCRRTIGTLEKVLGGICLVAAVSVLVVQGLPAGLATWWWPLAVAGGVLFFELGHFMVAQSFVDQMREVWTTLLEDEEAVRGAGRLTMQ